MTVESNFEITQIKKLFTFVGACTGCIPGTAFKVLIFQLTTSKLWPSK